MPWLTGPNVTANGIFIPVMPAPPNSSAWTDHSSDPVMPKLTSVSMVVTPCRRPATAARCNGHPPQAATGSVSSRLTHCHPLNCSDGAIASTMTASAAGAQTTTRSASPRAAAADSASGSPAAAVGSAAVYPAARTAVIRSAASCPPRRPT